MSASDDEAWITICKKPHIVEIPDDFITNLPDDVVSHILSRLPTRDALKTSVLSRAWEHKWTTVYDFDIDSICVYDVYLPGCRIARFANCVTRILERTCNSTIRRFCLSCENIASSIDIEMWISSVLKRNVEILKINASNLRQPFDSQWCFSNWASLSELELSLDCTVQLPANSCFPNLKKLLLSGRRFNVRIKAEKISSEGGIILNFPVLEVLVLNHCEWMDVNFVEIHAPELIQFETKCLYMPKSYEIRMFGPKLDTFRVLYGCLDNFYLCTPAVSSAELTDCQARGETLQRTQKILKQIPGLTRLKISHSVVHAFLTSQPRLVFPIFDRLTELNLCDSGPINVLLKILQLLPPLELLYVNVHDWDYFCKTGQTMPLWPPKIVSNLKKIELKKFKGSKLELDLENAKNLEQMSFIIGYGMTREKANNQLSNLKPKNSCIL